MTQLSSKTLLETDPWNTYNQIKFISIQKSKKERKDVQGQNLGLLELWEFHKFYIISDSVLSPFAM